MSKNLFIYDEIASNSLIQSQRWKPRTFAQQISKVGWYRWLQANSELFNILVKILWKHTYFEDLTHNFNPEKSQVPIPNLDSFDAESEYPTKLAYSIINQIDSWCDLNDCEFLVINTGFFKTKKMSSYDQKFYEWFKNDSLKLKGIYHDNSPCIQKQIVSNLDEIRISGDSHPNEKGAKIIADCTWGKLEKEIGD